MCSIPIILTSNASKDLYPKNNQHDFANTFPQTLHLNNKTWKIGLQSIVLDCNFSNVPQDVLSLESVILTFPHDTYKTKKEAAKLFQLENQIYTVSKMVGELDKYFESCSGEIS